MLRQLVAFLFTWPKTVTFCVIFTVVVGAYLSAKIPFDFSTENLFLSEDPHKKTLERFKKIFGRDDKLVIFAFSPKSLWTKKSLERIHRLSEKFKKIQYVGDVLSLVDALAAEEFLIELEKKAKLWKLQFPHLSLEEILPHLRPELLQKELQKKRDTALTHLREKDLVIFQKRILQNPFYVGNLISQEGDFTAIVLFLSEEVKSNREREKLFQKLEECIQRENQDGFFSPFYLAGMPVVRREYAHMVSGDHLTFLPIVVVLCFAILFWIFRNLWETLVPPLAIGASVVWTIGLMSALGQSINILSNVIYVLLFVIGIATSVHILTYYNAAYENWKNKKLALKETILHMGRACFFTTFTTAIGFLSLVITDIWIIRQFGFFSGIGIFFVFLSSVFVIPLFLFFVPPPREKGTSHLLLRKSLLRLAYWNHKNNTAVLLLLFLGLALSGWGIRQLKRDTQMLEELKSDHPLVISHRIVEEKLGGVLPLEILIEAKEPELLWEREELERIDRLVQFLHHYGGLVAKVIAPTDMIKTLHMALHGYDKRYFSFPKETKILKPFFLFFEQTLVKQNKHYLRFTACQQGIFRISARLKDEGTKAHFLLIQEIKRFIEKDPGFQKYKIVFTGEPHMSAIVIERLISNMLASIFLAAAIIFLVMVFLFRSFKIALLSTIPNLVPITFTLGAMGFLGITLRTSTVVVFSISLGIAVDDTIHYLLRYRTFLDKKADHFYAMKKTLCIAGGAMCWTTWIICTGLFVLLTSEFQATVDFGILGTVTLLSALFGDLVLLPVLLEKFTTPSDFSHF